MLVKTKDMQRFVREKIDLDKKAVYKILKVCKIKTK